jgi:transposase
MEWVLTVYRRPFDPAYPVICMDETPRQLIRETRLPIPARPGQYERHDYEYARCGVCNVFMATEPLAGKRITKVTERRTKIDWAHFLSDIAERYAQAERITLVMDNLNTHRPGALYEAYSPEQAKALWDRFEFVYTPRHGSWLNVAEIELNVMISQCLNRRIDSIEELRDEVAAWQAARDRLEAKVNWQFTAEDARVKLKRLYPTFDA